MYQQTRPLLLRRLLADRRGNVLMLMGFAIVPLTFSTGMAIDYTQASRLQTKLNAVADAAALAAVTEPMMHRTKDEAAVAALNMFQSQSTGLKGLRYTVTAPRVTITATSSTYDYGALKVVITQSDASGLDRTAVVSYAAASANAFAGILGMATLSIKGSSTTTAKIAPNIDFYVMLDVSSSMALPTTTAGIDFMKSKTKRFPDDAGNTKRVDNPNGCAFACHQSNPDNPAIKNAAGTIIDYYTYAHLNGYELRIDAGKRAIVDMMTKAQQKSTVNQADYRFAMSTFSRASDFKEVLKLPLNGGPMDYPTGKTQVGTAQTVAVAMHAHHYDRQTEHADSMIKQQAIMPTTPGLGTDRADDKPQAMMFLITDGMRDEERSGRQMGAMPEDQCTAIKARGIRIAVLYTTYQPESVNYDSWSVREIIPRLPTLSPALQRCATPGLFFQVSTDENISSALAALFDKAIATARITN